jgi:hypothetical protein
MSKTLDKDGLQRKDLITALILWAVCEFVGFVMFPAMQLIQVDKSVLRNWFLTSLPLGLGGILLTLAAARLSVFNTENDHQLKSLSSYALAISGWVALAGILYPLGVASFEFFTKGVPGGN